MEKGVDLMTQPLEGSIVRIGKEDGSIVGLGFLIDNKTILTCAHVISEALGVVDSPRMPESCIHLDFPLLNPGKTPKILRAHIISWSPESEDDIAGLELDNQLPEGAQSIILTNGYGDDLWGHGFRAFGFPASFDNGVWASGVLRAETANGWMHIEDTKGPGHRVEPGFSGSPIWDDELKAVIGMVVAAETEYGNKVAFIIPAKILIKHCHDKINSKQIPLGKSLTGDKIYNFRPCHLKIAI